MNIFSIDNIAERYKNTFVNGNCVFPWGDKYLPANGKMLDIGCGRGETMKYIDSICPNVIVYGIDSSKGMVKSTELDNVKYACAEKLPYDDEEFSTVITRFAYKWFHNPSVALSEVHRVLVPQGFFLHWDSGKDEMREVLNIIYPILKDVVGNDDYKKIVEYFENLRRPFETVNIELQAANFTIDKICLSSYKESFQSLDEFRFKWWEPFSVIDTIRSFCNIPDGLETRILSKIESNGLVFTHDNYGFIARKNQ